MKRFFCFLLIIVLLCSLGTTAFAVSFSDVPSDAWYVKDLEIAVSKGLIQGVGNNMYNPNANISYAQFLTILVREKFGEQPQIEGKEWYVGYIDKAVETGIVDPAKEIPRGWDVSITRGMMTVFMCRSLGIAPDSNIEILFADASNPTSSDSVMKYYQYLTKAYKEYLIDGTSFGTGSNLRMNTGHWLPVTRAQLATIINRVSEYRNNPVSYKAERAKLRDASFLAKELELAKNYGIKLQSSSEHFDFITSDSDVKTIPDLTKRLEDNYARITNDLETVLQEKVSVFIYPDIITFHKAINMPDAPNWVVGTGGNYNLTMVSPLNPGGVHTYDDLMLTIVHEFAHVVTRNINSSSSIKWLWEGIATYEAKQQANVYTLKQAVSSNTIPTFKQMETAGDIGFGDLGGYSFAYTIIEFLQKNYGMEKIAALIKNTNDYQGALGVSKDELEKLWVQYLRNNYS